MTCKDAVTSITANVLLQRGTCKNAKKCKHRTHQPTRAEFDGLIAVCDTCGLHSHNMQLCSGCRTVRYCTKECQRIMWKSGRHRCKVIRETIVGETSYNFEKHRASFLETALKAKNKDDTNRMLAVLRNFITYHNYCLIMTEWATPQLDAYVCDTTLSCPIGVARLVKEHPTRLYVEEKTIRCTIPAWCAEILQSVHCIFRSITRGPLMKFPPLHWAHIGRTKFTSRHLWLARPDCDNHNLVVDRLSFTIGRPVGDDPQTTKSSDAIYLQIFGGWDGDSELLRMSLKAKNKNADTDDVALVPVWQKNICCLHDRRVETNDVSDEEDIDVEAIVSGVDNVAFPVLWSSVSGLRGSNIIEVSFLHGERDIDYFSRQTMLSFYEEDVRRHNDGNVCECLDFIDDTCFRIHTDDQATFCVVRIVTDTCGILDVFAIVHRGNVTGQIDSGSYTNTWHDEDTCPFANPFVFTCESSVRELNVEFLL